MSLFGRKKQTGSKIKEVVYVSKLGKKHIKSEEREEVYVSKLGNKRVVKCMNKNNIPQRKGVRKSFVKRYINIITSYLNVLRHKEVKE